MSCDKGNKKKVTDKSSDSISIYFSLVKDERITKENRLKYNKRVFEIINTKKNSKENRENLNEIGINYNELKDHKEFRKVSRILLANSIEEKDTLNIARALKNLGSYQLDVGQNDSSFYYYLKAEKFAKYLKDSVSIGEILIDKAFIQINEGDFNGSEYSAIKSLRFLHKSKNKLKIYDAYNIVGACSNQLKNYKKALEYHYKALNYLKTNNLNSKFHLDANSLNNIGYVYQNMNMNEDAVENFNLALNTKDLYNDNPSLYAMLLDNLAYSKFKIKDYSEVSNLFYRSLKIRESLNVDFSGIILTKIHLSEFFAAKKDSVKSQQYANDALDFSKKTKVSSDVLASLKQLSLVEHKNSGKYSKEYIRISDSIQLEERKSKDKFARIAFETDEIIQEKDKLTEQNRTLLYFFIGTLLLGLLLFVIRTQRAKNRELLLKQQQQIVNEEIYNLMISQQATIEENRVKEKKRIAQELHDGVLGRLFGARLNLDSLNRFNDEDSINSRFNYLAELKNIEQDIREISHDLNREKYVLINNFVAIVSNLLEEQINSFEADLSSSLDESIQWDKVSNAVKINLYRILQESLQNINKYANAKHISVEFKKDNEHISLKITDDGIGFDVNTKKRGIGLQNMQSRVNECEGTFEIKSKKGKGTTTTVLVPLEKKVTEV
ncbi:sensor histidine kinase [Flavobacterium sp.]|uniref:tetratricopeptide repeat-containing sensor histidine kinase n=1 Tax=Flavobacterium sp. TaxID=239 RepID=UPI00263479BF|nr:sensor histidine kinase [Flavobacterium sp.]